MAPFADLFPLPEQARKGSPGQVPSFRLAFSQHQARQKILLVHLLVPFTLQIPVSYGLKTPQNPLTSLWQRVFCCLAPGLQSGRHGAKPCRRGQRCLSAAPGWHPGPSRARVWPAQNDSQSSLRPSEAFAVTALAGAGLGALARAGFLGAAALGRGARVGVLRNGVEGSGAGWV